MVISGIGTDSLAIDSFAPHFATGQSDRPF
jgi:hypothetical protein